MFKKAILTILFLVGGILGYAALQSPDFTVTRSILIAAPADAIFPLVNDFHRWSEWSPWAKLDPQMKESHEGAPTGVGAIYRWEGNYEVGQGSMTMRNSIPPQALEIQLDFLKPFPGTNTADFTFTPDGANTKVTWTMRGKNHFFCRVISVFMNIDGMIGAQFEQGLGALKKLTENK